MYLEFTEPWATTRHDSVCVFVWVGGCVSVRVSAPILSHTGQPGKRVTFSDPLVNKTKGLYIIKHHF